MTDVDMTSILIEQAVYGSFPFWDRGYGVLARSPGCRAEWMDSFTSACSRFGERPRTVSRFEGLFVLPMPSGVWMIVGVREQGDDDQGRPGALAFHALFVSDADYRRCGASPFPFARWHRGEWGPEVETLPTLSERVGGGSKPHPGPKAGRIARALTRGQKVAVVTDRPIDDLGLEVWNALAPRLRARNTLATWAFGVENRFDLVGLPSRPNLAIPDGYVNEADLIDSPRPSPPRLRGGTRHLARSVALLMASLGLLALAGAWFAWSGPAEINTEPEPKPGTVRAASRPDPAMPTPAQSAGIDPEARRRIGQKLRDLGHRFGIGEGDRSEDPGVWMRRMASELRYHGPLLSEAERARLRRERASGRARALAWDEQIRRFVPDRPLPNGFEDRPLNAQLSAFAWSFHVPIDPRLTPVEIPDAVGYALSVDGPTHSNPLSGRYPDLLDYARFLDRLPRR